jgi:hypothetical protein
MGGFMRIKQERDYEYIDKSVFKVEDEVIRWIENNSVPPAECLERFLQKGRITVDQFDLSTTVREQELDIFLASYRKAMENWEPSAEERYEARAAFGEGHELVNVVTGKRWTT